MNRLASLGAVIWTTARPAGLQPGARQILAKSRTAELPSFDARQVQLPRRNISIYRRTGATVREPALMRRLRQCGRLAVA